jgi:hypothetical protein
MHGQKDDMLILGQLEQSDSEQRSTAEVERSLRFIIDKLTQVPLSLVHGEVRERFNREVEWCGRRDELKRNAIHRRKAGPQDLVTTDDFTHRPL